MSATERWKAVSNWPYEVSDRGQVRRSAGGHGAVRGKVIRPYRHRGKYFTVSLRKPGQRANMKVHHLVATAFHGPRPAGLVSRHLNGDMLDNSAENLAWGTQKQNMDDRADHGTYRNHNAERTHCRRGHELSPDNIYQTRGKGRTCKTCATMMRHARHVRAVDPGTVQFN